VDTIKIRYQRVVRTLASVLDQDLRQADDSRDRRAEFLPHEGGKGALKALVWFTHDAP
jgi:hypothetical protein